MKEGITEGIMIGILSVMLVSPTAVLAGQGRGPVRGTALQTQSRDVDQVHGQKRFENRSRHGQTNKPATTAPRNGASYGPGDGSGNDGAGPKDGTGYGAPTQR